MKQNINKIVIAGILAFGCVFACKKKLDVVDENNPTTISYFKIAEELRNGVNAIYYVPETLLEENGFLTMI